MQLLKRIVAISLALIFSITPAAAVLGPDSIPPVFEELMKNPTLANPAMVVIDGSTGAVVYQHNAFSQRKPASVMKILSAGVTIEYLDLQSSFNTTVSINPAEKMIVIRGSLDPWISLDHNVGRKMHRASLPYMGFSTLTAIKQANGGSLKNYKVIYSNLYSQDIANLKTFWSKRGFKPVIKAVSDDDAFLQQGDLVASENSPTVAEILDWTLLWSDNLLSERMARLAAKASGNEFNDKGVAITFATQLIEMGIDPSKIIVKDASGLSRENKVTANVMAKLLYKIHSDPLLASLIEGLPVGGESGTLRRRYVETAPDAVGLVKAKTGTLTGTVSLAGYVQSGEREYAFVVIADKIKRTNAASDKARKTLDRYLAKIAAPLLTPVVDTATVVTDSQTP